MLIAASYTTFSWELLFFKYSKAKFGQKCLFVFHFYILFLFKSQNSKVIDLSELSATQTFWSLFLDKRKSKTDTSPVFLKDMLVL